MKDFVFEPKFTPSEELAYKAVLDVESRKTSGMFCIVFGTDNEPDCYS